LTLSLDAYLSDYRTVPGFTILEIAFATGAGVTFWTCHIQAWDFSACLLFTGKTIRTILILAVKRKALAIYHGSILANIVNCRLATAGKK
jgi:hypothetical protein